VAGASETEKVTLQLKWFHQFQFAGYYAAKEKGFYQNLGLDVDIKEKHIDFNNIDQVISGEAQYGVADSVLILYKIRKKPIVIVSPILQHSPSVLIALKKSGINSPYELNDKKIIFYQSDADGFSILAMLNQLDIKPNLIRTKKQDDYLKLINGDVDLTPVYLSNELFHFKRQKIDVNIINPMNYGIDLYGDMLFTNKNEVNNHPDRVKRFKEATLKGWEYALNNKEEIIQLIYNKYSTDKSLEHLRYEANAIDKIISKETIPIGSIDKGRVQYISNLYKKYGLAEDSLDIKDFIFEEFKSTNTTIKFTQQEKEYLVKNPVLRVQNMPSFPPFNFNDNNQAMGYSIEFTSLLAEKAGISVEFISGKSWEENLQMLKDDELDVLPNVAINQDRKAYIDFTTFDHFDYFISIAVRKEQTLNSMSDLKGKVVSVLNKSFLHAILENKYPEQKLYLAPTVKDAVAAVSSGKADAVIANLATIDYYIQKDWLSNLKNIQIGNLLGQANNVPFYFGVSKGNLVLKSILEKANASLTLNEIVELKQKWLNTLPISNVKFSRQEIEYMHNKKILNMCIDPNWMPFEKIEGNQHIGMTAEYIKLFQKELPIQIKLIKTESWLETLEFSKQRKCDFVSIMRTSKERKEYFNFTTPLMNMPMVIATQHDKPFINDISSVISERLGIVEGFAFTEYVTAAYPTIKLIKVKGTKEGLAKVKNGEVYGFIGELPSIGYSINEHFTGDLKIAGKVDKTLGFTMGTRNDEPLLNSIFNKLIAEIPTQKNKDILNKWLSIKYEEQVNYTNVIILGLFLLTVIAIVLYKNRSINKINSVLEDYIKIVDENVLTSSTDITGKITYVSQAFCEASEYTKEELMGENHSIIKDKDTEASLYKNLWGTISQGKVWKGELKNRKKSGVLYWTEASISPVFDTKNKITGYTATQHDITDKKRIEDISITDALTNIYNRRHFDDIFPKYVNSLKRDNGLFSFLIMDVDYFKQYNDIYGHQKGDEILQLIALTLKNKLHRADDYCFRLGGEEFGLLFKSEKREDVLSFVESIRVAIEALHVEHSGSNVSQYVTVSIGLYSVFVNESHHTSNIYKDADVLLYKAKENGRNQTMLNEYVVTHPIRGIKS
jgi:diguanylate cyclase (GGDEF)-like protein/PAS domain S-box-containing protein